MISRLWTTLIIVSFLFVNLDEVKILTFGKISLSVPLSSQLLFPGELISVLPWISLNNLLFIDTKQRTLCLLWSGGQQAPIHIYGTQVSMACYDLHLLCSEILEEWDCLWVLFLLTLCVWFPFSIKYFLSAHILYIVSLFIIFIHLGLNPVLPSGMQVAL